MTPADYITDRLVRRISEADGAMKGFGKELLKDPGHAFEWADATMKIAASVRPMKIVLKAVHEGELSLEQIAHTCREEALRSAANPRQSTSATSNTMHLYEGAAWAELADLLAGGI